MTIEGIPDGWELVAFRRAVSGDYFLNARGLPEPWTLNVSSSGIYPIIRKIEKPKRYRPFANAAEFEPYRDRWIVQAVPHTGYDRFYKVSSFDFEGFWVGGIKRLYNEAFSYFRFESGTPCGIEVTE